MCRDSITFEPGSRYTINKQTIMIKLHKITGHSMAPAFNDGDFVVTARRWLSQYQQQDVVVVNHETYGVIIKRIQSVLTDGRVRLQGDNRQSTSTSQLGNIERKQIIGRVCWHIKARRP